MEGSFNCAMCGQCCKGAGGIVSAPEEQQAMADYLGLSLPEFQKKYIYFQGSKYFVRTDEKGTCLFFENRRGCIVHPAKPKTCRAWPFFRGNLMDESSFEMAREYCPGINPEISFADFVSQGMDYLKQHDIVQGKGPSPANALDIRGIKF